jgi:hypothetical protein
MIILDSLSVNDSLPDLDSLAQVDTLAKIDTIVLADSIEAKASDIGEIKLKMADDKSGIFKKAVKLTGKRVKDK